MSFLNRRRLGPPQTLGGWGVAHMFPCLHAPAFHRWMQIGRRAEMKAEHLGATYHPLPALSGSSEQGGRRCVLVTDPAGPPHQKRIRRGGCGSCLCAPAWGIPEIHQRPQAPRWTGRRARAAASWGEGGMPSSTTHLPCSLARQVAESGPPDSRAEARAGLSSYLRPAGQVLLSTSTIVHTTHHPSGPSTCPQGMLRKKHRGLPPRWLSTQRYLDATFTLGAKAP